MKKAIRRKQHLTKPGPKGSVGYPTTYLFSRWTKMVMCDGIPSKEAIDKIADETGLNRGTLRAKCSIERWFELAGGFLPASRPMTPTTTTAHDVLDQERARYLEISQRMAKEWTDSMNYLRGEFDKAVENGNTIMASEMISDMAKLSLMAQRAQEVAMHSTCDSGSSTAITEAGSKIGNAPTYAIYLSPMMSKARIPQPGAPVLELQTLPETPPIPAQGETNGAR
jgi:hypothetical protein